MISIVQVQQTKEQLLDVIRDCLPLDEKDSRHERLMQAIDTLIQCHIAMARTHSTLF